MKSNTKKVQSILHMCHMDQRSEERRKVGWQTPKSTLKGAIVPPFDKYNFFKPQCPHLFNHQISNFLNLAGRYPPPQTNSHEPRIILNLEKSQSKEANN